MIELLFSTPIISDSDVIWWIESAITQPENRPYFNSPYYSEVVEYYHLDKKVHNWLVEHAIKYNIFCKLLDEHYINFGISFENKSDAMLFKLRWL